MHTRSSAFDSLIQICTNIRIHTQTQRCTERVGEERNLGSYLGVLLWGAVPTYRFSYKVYCCDLGFYLDGLYTGSTLI